MKTVTRRDFVKSSIAAGVMAVLPFSRVRGANDRIRVKQSHVCWADLPST